MKEDWKSLAEAMPQKPELTPLQDDTTSSYLNRLKESVYTTDLQHVLLDGYAALEELGMDGLGVGLFPSEDRLIYSLPQGSELLNSSLGTLNVMTAVLSHEGDTQINVQYQRVRNSRPIKFMEKIFGKDMTDFASNDAIKRREASYGRPKVVEHVLANEIREIVKHLKEGINPVKVSIVAQRIAILLFEKHGIDPLVQHEYFKLLAKKYSSQITPAE